MLSLKAMLQHYISHRRDVVTRRTRHELETARDRAHILEGLIKVLDNLDETIRIIRAAQDEKAAQASLEERFELTDRQSKAIVDLRLGRLTRLESGKLREEYEELIKQIASSRTCSPTRASSTRSSRTRSSACGSGSPTRAAPRSATTSSR